VSLFYASVVYFTLIGSNVLFCRHKMHVGLRNGKKIFTYKTVCRHDMIVLIHSCPVNSAVNSGGESFVSSTCAVCIAT
jgi:hypothetical protein